MQVRRYNQLFSKIFSYNNREIRIYFLFTYSSKLHCIIGFKKIVDETHVYQKPDSKQYLGLNMSQMLMFLNVPVNLTVEKYKIDLPKNIPITGTGNQIGNIL